MEWKEVTLGDFMQCNPKRTIKKGQKARKITMDLLIPHSKTIRNWNYEPYSGGAKFQNGDTIMARITPCLEMVNMLLSLSLIKEKLHMDLQNILCFAERKK